MLLKFGSLALSVIFSFPIISLAQGYKDTFKLKEVVVTGSIKELRREDFAIPVEIYTKDFFYNTNVVNLLDAIRYISGLQANIDGAVDGASDLEINGLEGTYALVMIDGAPITGGVGNLYGLMGIPLSMIERIEVIKGPCSTLYGTEALAGVINIITTNPEKASKVFADIRMSSYLETAADVSCRLKEGKAYGILGLSYYGMNYKWDWNKDNFTDLPVQNRISLLNKWALRNRYQKQSNFLARYVWENRSGGQMQYNSKWRGSDSIYGEAAKTNRLELLGNIAFPTAKTNLDLMFGFSHHNADAAYGTNIFLHQEQNGYVQLIYDNKISRISDFLLGVAYRFNRYDDNLLTTADTLSGKLLNKPFLNHYPAIFLQDMIHVNEQHEILAGFRLEYNSYFTGVAFAPRFDYKWTTKDKTKELRAGIGSGYRTPNAFIDNKYAFTSGRRIVLDEALKTETCYGVYTDYIHKINTSRANIFWEARLFFNFLFNMVEMETDFSNNLIIYKNEDSYGMNFGINTMFDVNFDLPIKINLGINLLGNYSLEEDEEQIGFERLINSPFFNGTFSFQYCFKKVGITIDWNGYVNSPMRMSIQPNDPRGEYSPWYTIQNIQMRKSIQNRFDFFAGIQNILNVKPPQPILRPNDPFNRNVGSDGLVFDATYNYAPNQGIKGFIGFRYNF